MTQQYTKQEIRYPKQTTYWIFWVNKTNDFDYGITEPYQITLGYRPFIWTTADEKEWIEKLETEFNTNPYPPEPDQELD